MRRDWKAVLTLLDVSEQLAGHPNLKSIRDEAHKDLEELVAQPPELPQQPETTYEPEPNLDPGTNAIPTETEPKIVRRSL